MEVQEVLTYFPQSASMTMMIVFFFEKLLFRVLD